MSGISEEQAAHNRAVLKRKIDQRHTESQHGVEALVGEAKAMLEAGGSEREVWVELAVKTNIRQTVPGLAPPSTVLVEMLCEAAVQLAQGQLRQ